VYSIVAVGAMKECCKNNDILIFLSSAFDNPGKMSDVAFSACRASKNILDS